MLLGAAPLGGIAELELLKPGYITIDVSGISSGIGRIMSGIDSFVHNAASAAGSFAAGIGLKVSQDINACKERNTFSDLFAKVKLTEIHLPKPGFDYFVATAKAEGETSEEITWSFDEESGELTVSGSGNMTNYSSASSVPWYSYRTQIKTVDISDSITSIGSYAFSGCTGLTEITISETVTYIGYNAFSGCTGLTEIIYNAKNVRDFRDTSNTFLNAGKKGDGIDVIFGETVEKIPAYIFYVSTSTSRPNIKSIKILSESTTVGSSAFYGCDRITTAGPAGSGCDYEFAWTESIPANAFSGCTGLTKAIIPDSVTSIGKNAFYNVLNISYSDNMTAAGSPWGARSVNGFIEGDYVYSDESKSNLLACSSNASGTKIIPASVTKVADRAFLNCNKIEKVLVKFRDSEPEWGVDVFKGCTSLQSIEYLPYGSGEMKGQPIYGDNGTRLIFCNKDRTEPFVLPAEVTVIEDNAFYNCSDIPSITLNNNLTKIGAHAFEGTVLYNESSRGGDGGLYIGNYLIDVSKEDLSDFTVNDGTRVIAAEAFSGCGSLESVSIPSSVIGIGSDAFAGCGNLETVNAECNNLQYVGESAFTGTKYYDENEGALYAGSALIRADSSSESFEIDNGTTCIADYAFSGLSSLKDVTIPQSVKTIGNYAFSGCENLSRVSLLEGLEEIGVCAFRGCGLREEVTIPSSVNRIGSYTFYECKDISRFTVKQGNNKYYSEDGVLFENNDPVTLVQYPPAKEGNAYTIPEETGRIANYAFSYADKLETITVPSGVSYRTLAFKYCEAVRDTVTLKSGTELSDDGTVLQQVTEDALDSGHYEVPSSVVTIAPGAFSSVKDKLTSINLNNTAIIGDEVFADCSNLSEVTGTESLLYIGDSAFKGTAVNDITVPASAYQSPGAFEDDVNITLSGVKQKIEISAESNAINLGEDAKLTAEITEGQLSDGDRIIWIDSDTGEIYGESETLTRQFSRNTGISAVVMNGNNVLMESNEIRIIVIDETQWTANVDIVDTEGNSPSDIIVFENESKTITLELTNWDSEKLKDIEVRWMIDGTLYNTGTSCEVETDKDFTVQLQYYYKGVKIKETDKYTVKLSVISPLINVPGSASVDYRAKVTVTASAKDLPEGCVLAIYDGNRQLAKGDSKSVSYYAGEMTADRTFTVKAIDKNGNAVKDGNGRDIAATCSVKVKSGFFNKIIAFFKALFGALPSVEIKP